MTVPPIPFPTQFGGGAIMDPGSGAALAQGVANVLAQQQIQRENQFRLQQLQQQAAQQAALEQYYQGQISVQSREQASKERQQALERERLAQVGGVQARALGLGAPAAGPMTGAAPAPPNLGNQTQSMGGALTFRIGPGGTPPGQAALPMQIGGPPPAPGQGALSNPGPFQQVLQGGAQAIGGPATLDSIFTGVSPENMPAAVQGVQEVQALSPKPPELPTSAKEMEYYQRLLGRDPQQAALYKTLFLDPKPSTVINNIPAQGETEFSKELAKAQVQLLSKGEEEARKSVQAFPAMKEAYSLVGKAFTGFGANQLVTLARVAGAAGFKPGKDKAADSQALLKLTRDQTLAYLQTRALGSGTAVSDRDREFMERQSAADLTLEPTSIKRIIRINVGSGIMRMQEAIQDLRDQAMAYPMNAPQLNAKANALERQLAPIWQSYGQMLKNEEQADAQQADQLFPTRRP